MAEKTKKRHPAAPRPRDGDGDGYGGQLLIEAAVDISRLNGLLENRAAEIERLEAKLTLAEESLSKALEEHETTVAELNSVYSVVEAIRIAARPQISDPGLGGVFALADDLLSRAGR